MEELPFIIGFIISVRKSSRLTVTFPPERVLSWNIMENPGADSVPSMADK